MKGVVQGTSFEVLKTPNEWLLRDGEANEPWAFIIAADGTIAARWDNLFTQPELEDGLKKVLRPS